MQLIGKVRRLQFPRRQFMYSKRHLKEIGTWTSGPSKEESLDSVKKPVSDSLKKPIASLDLENPSAVSLPTSIAANVH
jgi:hypothetical protein